VATYSIAAIDAATSEFGSAATSCLGGQDVSLIYRSVRGIGIVLAQAYYSGETQQRAVELLAGGMPPAEIIADVTSQAIDPDAARRQYAIVDASGRIAAFTGAMAPPVATDWQGAIGKLGFTVQGNSLTDDVVERAATGFAGDACDLAERLLLALEAGASGGGDSRCSASGIPSDSAYLEVVSVRDGDVKVSLRVPSSGEENPLIELRAAFEEFRREHPCRALTGGPRPVEARNSTCTMNPRTADSTASWWLGLLAAHFAARRRKRARLGAPWRSKTC
jgi:uncharacterized Ntn-hydrolase superfamily protein